MVRLLKIMHDPSAEEKTYWLDYNKDCEAENKGVFEGQWEWCLLWALNTLSSRMAEIITVIKEPNLIMIYYKEWE